MVVWLVMKFQYLTFDCYGTLIDWRSGIEAHLGELLGKKGFSRTQSVFPIYARLEAEEESDYKPYREVLKDTAMRIAGHFEVPVTEQEAGEFAASIARWPPFSDTTETLRELGRRGYKRIILSNVDRDLLEATISHNGLEVDGFVSAEDTRSYKPAVGHWNAFLERYQASKERTLHIAQSLYHDIRPAIRLGFGVVWINRYGEGNGGGVSPNYTFNDLKSLLGMLS
jgi:2-haloalkanoic acid dehalogenase type II